MTERDLPIVDEDHRLGVLHAERRHRYVSRTVAMVGFMGAGKSSMGRLVAEGLGREFHDIDAMIEARTGRAIVEMFASGDEPEFRVFEAAVIAELAERPPCVLSLGGGALARANTRELLFRSCFVVHLFVPWAQLRAQLPALRATRPVLGQRSETEIHSLYLMRQQSYRRAHLRIDARRHDLEDAARLILSALSGRA